MAKEIDFYQIYFKDAQLTQLYDFSIPYKNYEVSDYFENDVIKMLVPQSSADYISVCSWRLKEKREMGSCPFILKDTSLSKDKILSQDADIMNLRPFREGHKALTMALNWHGKAWELAFNELKKFIKPPEEVTHAIYENHFIARKEIYHEYVKTCLIPCIEFISEKEVFKMDSGYAEKLKREPERIKEYTQRTGKKDWPIAPFILERLFSIWIEGKGFKVINL